MVEYKPPHKLTQHTVVAGLSTQIDTLADVIHHEDEVIISGQNQEDQGMLWHRYTMAAVITQLFSYMVSRGTRYGHVTTGEAYVFLHIDEDPSVVYYSVQVPGEDGENIDPVRLDRTAVAQVSAFAVQAATATIPDQAWFQRTSCLNRWPRNVAGSTLDDSPEHVNTAELEDRDHRPAKRRRLSPLSAISSPAQTRARRRFNTLLAR